MLLGARRGRAVRDRRRRLICRQPTAAEIAAMPFEAPDEVAPDPDALPIIKPHPRPTKMKKPSGKSRFGQSSIVGTPGAKPGQLCGFFGCAGIVRSIEGGAFTVCDTCGNVEDMAAR